MTCGRCSIQGHNKKTCTTSGCDPNPFPKITNDEGNKQRRTINNQIGEEQIVIRKIGRPKKNKFNTSGYGRLALIIKEINT